MVSITRETRPKAERRQAPLGCCGAADHEALLADLEAGAIGDPDIATLLPRARYLLTGSVGARHRRVPWWAR